jgi:hypothetical protein
MLKITLKKDAPKEELEAAKKHVTDQGGKIVNEFTLIKGFTYVQPYQTLPPNRAVYPQPHWHSLLPVIVQIECMLTHRSAEIPDDAVSTLESNEHVTVEKDAEVRTQ